MGSETFFLLIAKIIQYARKRNYRQANSRHKLLRSRRKGKESRKSISSLRTNCGRMVVSYAGEHRINGTLLELVHQNKEDFFEVQHIGNVLALNNQYSRLCVKLMEKGGRDA